jgi:ABC-type phosphate/phosphonate transport system substrate-binding protein
MKLRWSACAAWALGMLFGAPVAAANLTLAVEPSYPQEQAEQVYQPLLDYLGRTTGHRFRLVVPRNYHFLWRDLRQNEPVDFAFEEAHFVDYRVTRHGFDPLVRTAEPTRYTLAAQAEQAEEGLDGLVGRRIACMPSPSLGFALLAELYKNPVAQPDIRSEAASWRDGVEMVFAGEAEAAMVQSYITDLYPQLVTIEQSRDFPGRALSAAAGVAPEIREAVKQAMLALHQDPEALEVLTELGTARFVPATRQDYAGSEQMLNGFFGYTPKP